jgi:DinB superfamily
MDARYPIGKFTPPQNVTPVLRAQAIETIAELPTKFRAAVKGLSDPQLDTPYREGGWTVRQVAHHVPESHMNAYVRLKLALTEEEPTIKPYDEALWAKLPDARSPIEVSLSLLDSLHERWVRVWRALQPADFARTLRHPEHSNVLTVDWLLFQYAWHSRHHTAHITELRKQKAW